MRWGLFYLPTSLPDTPQEGADRFRTIIEQVRYAEQIGFNSVWLAEHHFQAFGGMFPSTPLIGAAIAQHTETIRVGTAVVLLPYHNPIRIADCTGDEGWDLPITSLRRRRSVFSERRHRESRRVPCHSGYP